MSVFRPRSFLQLVLLGFVLVTLPLIIATIHTTWTVGRLADQSQQAVRDAVQVTQSSRLLLEHIIDTERYARQYHVLDDAGLFDAYATAHQRLVSLTSDMSRFAPQRSSAAPTQYPHQKRTCRVRNPRRISARVSGK